MKVGFFGYREWANKIHEHLESFLSDWPRNWELTKSITDSDVVLFYGWSSMIPRETYTKKLCLILHPSPLPKYRGGSPLQHQIINGEKTSAVTICKVTGDLDAGDIYSQSPLLLEGTLSDIFKRVIEIGVEDTIRVLDAIADKTIKPIPQDNSKATTYKRRKPEESEIHVGDAQSKTAEELYNFIRALADPYPNAFITCKDGKRLYFTGVHL